MSHQLTKTDLKALRQADDHYANHHDGAGSLVCVKRATRGEPFSEDRRFPVPTDSTFRAYPTEFDGVRHRAEIDSAAVSCFADLIGPAWRTVIDLLRVGDRLTLHWVSDGFGNGYTKNAKTKGEYLHVDMLRLIVHRPRKNAEDRRLTFDVDLSICPDNTARMIRGVRYEATEAA